MSQGLLTFANQNSVPASGYLISQSGGYIGASYSTVAGSFLSKFADGPSDSSSSQGVIGFEVQPYGQII